MRKKIIVAFILFPILTLPNAYSEPIEITINSSEVQLGDRSPGLPITWDESFEIPGKPYSAELSVERKDIDNCTIPVIINDTSIGSLPLDSGPYGYSIYTFAIPQGILLQGTNTIHIEARNCAYDEYDDIFFRRIALKYEAGYRWTNEGEDTAWDNPDNWDHPEYPSTNDAITIFDLPDLTTSYLITNYNDTINSMNILSGEFIFDSGTRLVLTAPSNSLVINGGRLYWHDGGLKTEKTLIGDNSPGYMSIDTEQELYSVSRITIGARAKGELEVVQGIVETPTISIGLEDEGHLTLFNEGSGLAIHDMYLGDGMAGRGYVSVGSDAAISVTNLISIGTIGYGLLVVENDGLATANNIVVGGLNFSLLVVKSGGEVRVTRNINIRRWGGIINSGDLQAAQINVQAGGYLTCNGTYTANIVVEGLGAVVVGCSPGTLTIDGNYLQQADGILEIEIGGMTPDSEHDLLQVTGNATLGGTLKLFFADGFAPQGGNPSTEDDTFDFIRVDGSINGSFSEVIVQGIEEGFQYDISPEGGTVKLTALSNGVPVCIDEDGDGYPRYAISSCPNSNEADCNDTNPDVNPGAEEIPNAIDDDCDGNIDGFGATTTIPECPPDYTDCGNGYCCPPETPVCGEGEDEGLCFEKGGCPVTEIYGEHSEEAELLRNVRDSILDSTPEGQGLIKLYYQWSPFIVKLMEVDTEIQGEVKEVLDTILPFLREAKE